MFDTVKLAQSYSRPPDFDFLINQGAKNLRCDANREYTFATLNGLKGAKEPRITIWKGFKGNWSISAEVSFGSWLFGSNLYVLNDEEIQIALRILSDYVTEKTGIVFDAFNARVTRADFFQDFQIGEENIVPIINRFKNHEIPKYITVPYSKTTVYFNNEGQEQDKTLKIYGKFRERHKKGNDAVEKEKANGILRLEVKLMKGAVRRLSKSIGFDYHHAKNLLNSDVWNFVIGKATHQLCFDEFILMEENNFIFLFKKLGFKEALILLGFLYLVKIYNNDLKTLEQLNINPKTAKRYVQKCRDLGIVSL